MDASRRPRVAVVTGSASGVGLGIVERFARDGYVTVITDITEVADQSQAGRLAAAGPRVEFQRMDVTDEAEVGEVLEGVASEHGSLDVLVDNAGSTRTRSSRTSP